MMHKEFEEFAKVFVVDMIDLLKVKGGDYSNEVDRLSNFKEQAKLLGVPARVIWAVYCHKHIDAVDRWVREGKLTSETIRSRFLDLANYALLGAALAEDLKDEGSVSRPEGFGCTTISETKDHCFDPDCWCDRCDIIVEEDEGAERG